MHREMWNFSTGPEFSLPTIWSIHYIFKFVTISWGYLHLWVDYSTHINNCAIFSFWCWAFVLNIIVPYCITFLMIQVRYIWWFPYTLSGYFVLNRNIYHVNKSGWIKFCGTFLKKRTSITSYVSGYWLAHHTIKAPKYWFLFIKLYLCQTYKIFRRKQIQLIFDWVMTKWGLWLYSFSTDSNQMLQF